MRKTKEKTYYYLVDDVIKRMFQNFKWEIDTSKIKVQYYRTPRELEEAEIMQELINKHHHDIK